MIYECIPKLIRAAMNNDRKNIESMSLLIGKKLKKENPKVAAEIMKILACSNAGTDVLRSVDISPLPVDRETRYQLVKFEEPILTEEPILNNEIKDELLEFLKEREMMEEFLEADIVPPNSILLEGKPGVGKTYIAKWLSFKLDMPMITLDLANSISSYLGRSGQNIKSIFQYTKEQNVLLFLDEMDAIAKRRDDSGDLGELKRLVNVLLKELEDCPITCVIIGATNHPELLDKAIWRRFDRNINIPLPEIEERNKLFERGLAEWFADIDKSVIEIMVHGTKEISAADICKLCEHIKRRAVLYKDESINYSSIKEYCEFVKITTKEEKINLCKTLKKHGKSMTIKKISEITKIPMSTVDRYLKG